MCAGTSRPHLLLNVSGSKLPVGDVTVDMPRSLTLGKSGNKDHKPKGKGNKESGALDIGDLMAVGNLAGIDGQSSGRLLSNRAMPGLLHISNRTKAEELV